MNILNASVPRHIYGAVRAEILHGLDPDYIGRHEPCIIFGVTSIPSRAMHFQIMCESGAQWARIPLHMLLHDAPEAGAPRHDLTELQCWDCYDWHFSTVAFDYLREMACEFRTPSGKVVPATYWFTLDHTDNSYSQYPPEHKCFHLLLLDDGSGQIAAMPNNRILWQDDSFIKRGHNLDYKVMAPVTWHAEERRPNPQDTAFVRDDY